jgi:hypothetical protein
MTKKYEIKDGWLIINKLSYEKDVHNIFQSYRSIKLTSISSLFGQYRKETDYYQIKLFISGFDTGLTIDYRKEEKQIFLNDLKSLQDLLGE